MHRHSDKTELMLVNCKRTNHLHSLPTSIAVANAQNPFNQSVNVVGFALDCHVTMNAHVTNIAQTFCVEPRRLASICRFLTSTVTATVVSAFILSRIDHCNSLLFGSTLDMIFFSYDEFTFFACRHSTLTIDNIFIEIILVLCAQR